MNPLEMLINNISLFASMYKKENITNVELNSKLFNACVECESSKINTSRTFFHFDKITFKVNKNLNDNQILINENKYTYYQE